MKWLIKFLTWTAVLSLVAIIAVTAGGSFADSLSLYLNAIDNQLQGNEIPFFVFRALLLATLLYNAEAILIRYVWSTDAPPSEEICAALTRRFRRSVIFVALWFEVLYWLLLA